MNKIVNVLTFSFFLIIMIFSCSPPVEQNELVDDGTIESKKAILQDKKAKIASLSADISKLEKDIITLDPNAFKGKPVLVMADKAKKMDFEEFTEVTGSIVTKGNFTANAQMGGTILRMNYEEGDRISKGKLVAEIDAEPLKKSREELELQLKLAKDVFERRNRLWAQKIGSEIDFITAKNQVEALEKSISSLDVQLDKNKVYAPASGVVEMVFAKQGELAGPGAPILSIVNTVNVQVEADVSENYLSSVKVGDEIMVEIPALELNRKAKISNIASMINPENRTFKIEAKISNSDRKLKPNMLTLVKIRQFYEKEAIVIPTNAIIQGENEDFVFIIDQTPQGKLAKKMVIERGKTTDNLTQVKSGLTGSETIIADGKNKVREGSLITVQE